MRQALAGVCAVTQEIAHHSHVRKETTQQPFSECCLFQRVFSLGMIGSVFLKGSSSSVSQRYRNMKMGLKPHGYGTGCLNKKIKAKVKYYHNTVP